MYVKPNQKSSSTELSFSGDGKVRTQVRLAGLVPAGSYVVICVTETGYIQVDPKDLHQDAIYMVGYTERAFNPGDLGILVVGGVVPGKPNGLEIDPEESFGVDSKGEFYAIKTKSIFKTQDSCGKYLGSNSFLYAIPSVITKTATKVEEKTEEIVVEKEQPKRKKA